MKTGGRLSKMVVTATTPVTYELPLGNEKVPLNPFLGKTLKLTFTHKITCMGCDRPIKKSYQDGYCFPCTQTLARSDLCILKPERCHFHLGTCREPEWGLTHCMIPHVVYLANTSGIKVGITRQNQLPIRWLDQGAVAALPLLIVPTRRISGLVECVIGKYISDKTNWRQMLMGQEEVVDLIQHANDLQQKLQTDLADIYNEFGKNAVQLNEPLSITRFTYPVLSFPQKITSLSFDKTPEIEGTLLGIKGQYLMFDQGVINIRRHSGYEVEISS
ncbi:MAG: DUF2797 domain-containing protein [Candidatus Berkiellales bacterium]